MIAYEQRLRQDLGWGFLDASKHFENRSQVHATMRRITQRLEELAIPYAVIGCMAMFFHGYRRFTDNVDILLTREGFRKAHESLEGRGYLPLSAGSKHLRDTDTGVKVKFRALGDFPGDDKPKPVAFPDPEEARVNIDGVWFLQLSKIVELKLSSGMTNIARLRDLADVQELIRVLNLPEELASQLHPFVRDKYREIWTLLAIHPQQPE
jgi:hypothetical protein